MRAFQPPPPPPAPPSPEALARLRAENDALTDQITNQALRQAAGALPRGTPGAGPGNVSVVKNEQGFIVVTGPDGRTVTYDPKVGMDEDAVQEMVQTALEPPRLPPPPGDRFDPIPVIGMVFGFLFLMTVVVSIARVLGKRAAAGAAGPGVPADLSARLARIEQAVEAVAIEVERISESERYSARLLTERLPERAGAPNGQGPALPTAAPTLDANRVDAGR